MPSSGSPAPSLMTSACPGNAPPRPRDGPLSSRCAETRQARPRPPARVEEPPPHTPPRRRENHQKGTHPHHTTQTRRLNDKVQAAFLKADSVVDAFNAYYGGTHFLVPAGVLIWLVLRHPGRYARSRTALAVTTGLAFVSFWLFPVAPPRLLPGRIGIVDTLTAIGNSGHLETSLINSAGDQYASMPSLHVAWAVWCALALYPVVRHWALRVLVVAYPLMTTLVVVATGNHFFLDAVAGTLLAGLTWAVVSRLSRPRAGQGGEQGPHPGDRDGDVDNNL